MGKMIDRQVGYILCVQLEISEAIKFLQLAQAHGAKYIDASKGDITAYFQNLKRKSNVINENQTTQQMTEINGNITPIAKCPKCGTLTMFSNDALNGATFRCCGEEYHVLRFFYTEDIPVETSKDMDLFNEIDKEIAVGNLTREAEYRAIIDKLWKAPLEIISLIHPKISRAQRVTGKNFL
jgi:hypothetical protein